MEYKFWVSEKTRVDAIKEEFILNDNIVFKEEEADGSAEIILTDPSNSDLLKLFHAGISFGVRRAFGKI